ncbi:MAG TPA: phosphohydrolase [Clostridiales bacterium]|nr:phosphohydrolase [Clostridiales bacterium]
MQHDFTILEKAISFAVEAHQGLPRKGTHMPYILHPLESAAIVGSLTDDLEVIAATVLHDVLEDTSVTEKLLRSEFGDRIADWVCAESENKRKGQPEAETWQLRKQETINHLQREHRLEVKMITLGDKLSNIRAIYWDYQRIGDQLWDRFNQKDITKIGWYYRSVADAIRELHDTPAWRELDELIGKVFGTRGTVSDTKTEH